MPFETGMALLSEVKARLDIDSEDTTDDAVLAEMLKGISGAIEAAAGRPLRRAHCVRERFTGGRPLIQVARAPIAGIHWIRESWDRDFETEGNYTELVEGTDYILEAGNERPGESGWIRRLNGDWPGNQRNPGLIEVCYTGGYRTPDEDALLATGTVTFDGSHNTDLVDVLSVAAHYVSGTQYGYLNRFMGANTAKVGVEYSSEISYVNRGLAVFRPGQVLIPAWEIVEATLTLYFSRADGTFTTSVDAHILPHDPLTYLNKPTDLWTLIGAAAADTPSGFIGTVVQGPTAQAVTCTLHADTSGFPSGTNMKLLNAMLRKGFLAFSFVSLNETPITVARAAGIATPRHATVSNRPSLMLVYRDSLGDCWGMPGDLRHACLLQTVADWQTRKIPSMRQETQRGVSISSGVSYLKDPSDLLPEVVRIAQRYSRMV